MSAWDYGVVAGYLLLLLGLGWRCRTSGSSSAEYFLAGRGMGWFPIGLSVMVTTFSAINFLALPGEVYGHGLYVVAALPIFIVAAGVVGYWWLPQLQQGQLTSLYELLERRGEVRLRRLASALFLIWRFFWMALALYASGRIISQLTGFPLLPVILVGGIVATFYTACGGMKAVMWSDVIQFFVLFGGVALGLYCCWRGRSWDWSALIAAGRLQPFYPGDWGYLSWNPTLRMTLWSTLIGVTVAFLARYGADQMVVQRYFAGRDLRSVQKGLWLNAGASMLTLGLLGALGLALYSAAGPAERELAAIRQLAALMRSFPVGMTGVMLAALLAATMSSIDSGINSCAAAWCCDFQPHFLERRYAGVVLTAGIGLTVTGLALWAVPYLGRYNSIFMLVNKFVNGLGSPLLALVGWVLLRRRFNCFGLFYGTIVGVVGSLAVSLGVKNLALHYYAAVNLLIALLSIYLFSCLGKLIKRK